MSWSTDGVGAGERFAYWREVVCDAILNVATQAPPEEFSARLTGRNFGALRFAAFKSTGYEIVRTRQHVARASEDSYLISLQLHGRSLISQHDDRIVLERNEIAIIDGARPFQIAFPQQVGRIVAVVPRAMIDRGAPWLRAPRILKIASGSPYAALARRHLLHLTAAEPALSQSAAALLTENLINLLTLASAPDLAPDRMRPQLQLQALLAFCRQNLHDAELSPPMGAAHLGISVRTLHLRFHTLGKSFGRWLLDARLDACGKALRDPRQRASGISEIAYRWGFNDLSHFNKSFRTHFGMPPRQLRSNTPTQ